MRRASLARLADLARLPDLASLALRNSSAERSKIVLAVLADLLRRGDSKDLYVAELTDGEAARGVAIAVRTAADAASLLVAAAIPPTGQENGSGGTACDGAAVQHLLGFLHAQLAAEGVAFIQAMREPGTSQPELVASGYEFLATLDYLVAERRPGCGPPATGAATGGEAGEFLRSFAYDEFFDDGSALPARDQLVALVDATYVGSRDCPAMERFRSAGAMVDAYRQSPAHDPAEWLVLVGPDHAVVGCLLSTPHLATDSLEITYMGLVPEARRRGYAAALVDQAWQIAESRGLSQLTLAVDRANEPAVKLYRRHGFELLASESVWGRAIAEEREISASVENARVGKMRVL